MITASPYDARDYLVAGAAGGLPDSASVEQHIHNVENQLSLGSCTANALGSAIELALKRNQTPRDVSRLYLYWYARRESDQTNVDAGSNIRLAFKALRSLGVPDEYVWPYVESQVLSEPPVVVRNLAQSLKVTRYESCGRFTDSAINNIKTAIAQGYPVVIGMDVTTQLQTLPADQTYTHSGTSLGGHAMLIVGYTPQGFTVLNSWGETWHGNGKFLLTYDIAKREIFDAWIGKEYTGVTYTPRFALPKPTVRVFLDSGEHFSVGQACMIYGGSPRGSVTLLPSASSIHADANICAISVPWASIYDLDFLQTGNLLNIYSNGTLLCQWAITGECQIVGSNGKQFPVTLSAGVIRIGYSIVSDSSPYRLL